MSATIAGSSWTNPIWYRNYRIFRSDLMIAPPWTYIHDDYDSADDYTDPRHGYCDSIDECKAEIDEREDAE